MMHHPIRLGQLADAAIGAPLHVRLAEQISTEQQPAADLTLIQEFQKVAPWFSQAFA